jgi:hypothetical protein
MLAPIALVLAITALLLAAGALAMTIQQKKRFESLLSTVRKLEERPAPQPALPSPADPAPEPKTDPVSAPGDTPEPEPAEIANVGEGFPTRYGSRPAEGPNVGEGFTPSRSAEIHEAPPPGPDPEPTTNVGEEFTSSRTTESPEAPTTQPELPQPTPDPAWQAWLDQLRALPHGAVAGLLGEVLQHSKHLALGFADPAQRQAFASEVGEGFQRRLTHFQLRAQDESSFVERWVEPDLITALDLLARFQSQAAADARDGHAPAAQLATWLAGALYDQLGPACQAEGWFSLERIEPFSSAFDPQLHKGIDGRAVAGARGLVVEVERVGRLHAFDGYPLHKAHVVVGR